MTIMARKESVDEGTLSFQQQFEEKARREQLANFLGQGRYETKVLVDVLKGFNKPIQYKEILAQVNQRVEFDRNDGLTPPYAVTINLVGVTLRMMADLGAVAKMNRKWSFTERGQQVINLLSEHP